MIEDMESLLNSKDSDTLNEEVYLIKKIDSQLLREGFRILYTKFHRENLPHLLKSYSVFRDLIP